MLEVKYSGRFRKDVKRAQWQGRDMRLLTETIKALAEGRTWPPHCRDHALAGQWKNFRECHLTPDWLLVYRIYADVLVLSLTATDSHTDVFD